MSTTHITGVAITACGRVIQRCSLCGLKLCDSKNAAMPITPEDPEPKFPTWETGRLLRIHEGNPEHHELLEDSDKLPEDSCLALIED